MDRTETEMVRMRSFGGSLKVAFSRLVVVWSSLSFVVAFLISRVYSWNRFKGSERSSGVADILVNAGEGAVGTKVQMEWGEEIGL